MRVVVKSAWQFMQRNIFLCFACLVWRVCLDSLAHVLAARSYSGLSDIMMSWVSEGILNRVAQILKHDLVVHAHDRWWYSLVSLAVEHLVMTLAGFCMVAVLLYRMRGGTWHEARRRLSKPARWSSLVGKSPRGLVRLLAVQAICLAIAQVFIKYQGDTETLEIISDFPYFVAYTIGLLFAYELIYDRSWALSDLYRQSWRMMTHCTYRLLSAAFHDWLIVAVLQVPYLLIYYKVGLPYATPYGAYYVIFSTVVAEFFRIILIISRLIIYEDAHSCRSSGCSCSVTSGKKH